MPASIFLRALEILTEVLKLCQEERPKFQCRYRGAAKKNVIHSAKEIYHVSDPPGARTQDLLIKSQ